jgi:hypothetical protein
MIAGAGRLAADPPGLAVALAVDIIRTQSNAPAGLPTPVRAFHGGHYHAPRTPLS